MKLISYRRQGTESFGVVTDGGVVDMSGAFTTLKEAIGGLGLSRLEAEAVRPPDFGLDEIEHMFPITEPEKIFCIGRNYRAYHEVLADGGPKWPSVFPRFASSFAAHGEPILRPAASEQLDFEGELAVIIGKPGRHIPQEAAFDYVAGYTIINEGSVRDWLRRGTQNSPGKNFYHSGAIGPWMVTADEIPDPTALRIVTRVDGEVRQDGGTDMMIFEIPFLVAHISTYTWLEPGDMIATGSPGGSAIEDDEPRWLCAGQEIEVEIAPIGTLKNPVRDE